MQKFRTGVTVLKDKRADSETKKSHGFAKNKTNKKENKTKQKTQKTLHHFTVCFFAIVTKDDGITRPNDFTLISAMNQFKE